MLFNVDTDLSKPPVPVNELDRILSLSGFDFDYSNHQNDFKDLAKLAAKVAGTSMSMVNMIDSLTQWTISNYGLDLQQMLREDSVCQYTIMEPDHFQVEDLSQDQRFKDKSYVQGEQRARFYYGVPLSVGNGLNIGALCVLDREKRVLDFDTIESLKIIAAEIVNRLKTFKTVEALKSELLESSEIRKKLAHDIRGPLGGIIGLSGILIEQGQSNQLDEVLTFASLIHESGNSVLDLADEILGTHKNTAGLNSVELSGKIANPINLTTLKDKIQKLYQPQAVSKNISFEVNISAETESIIFSRNKLLQIIGNLISNALKFTPYGGHVLVDLAYVIDKDIKTLVIKVSDNGIGVSQSGIMAIMEEKILTTDGTGGEHGYGLGLELVSHLVRSLNGRLSISSTVGSGSVFSVQLPQ